MIASVRCITAAVMFSAISLLQLREAAESVSASPASSPSDSSSPLPAPSFPAHATSGSLSVLPQLPAAPVAPTIDTLAPLCLSATLCFRAQSVLSRPPPSREEKACGSSPTFSPGLMRIGVELKQQTQTMMSSADPLPIFTAPRTETSHVGSFAVVVHLDSNKVRLPPLTTLSVLDSHECTTALSAHSPELSSPISCLSLCVWVCRSCRHQVLFARAA